MQKHSLRISDKKYVLHFCGMYTVRFSFSISFHVKRFCLRRVCFFTLCPHHVQGINDSPKCGGVKKRSNVFFTRIIIISAEVYNAILFVRMFNRLFQYNILQAVCVVVYISFTSNLVRRTELSVSVQGL